MPNNFNPPECKGTDHGSRQKWGKTEKCLRFFHIPSRTYQRWVDLYEKTGSFADLRPTAERNCATSVDRNAVLDILHSEEFADLPPCEIIPILVDREGFIASESTFYRISREEKENNHRGLTKEPERKPKETHKATGPNQVWMWDITYLRSDVKGIFHYLYYRPFQQKNHTLGGF